MEMERTSGSKPMVKKAVIWCRFKYIGSLRTKLATLRPDIELSYMWVDDNNLAGTTKEGIACISYETVVSLWKAGEIDIVIISARRGNDSISKNVWSRSAKLEHDGVTEIYVMPSTLEKMPISEMDAADKSNILTNYKQFTELAVIKYLLYEGCNLNCSGCSHFSPINQHPKMLSIKEFENDLIMLQKKFRYIREIQFLGGEPLMNKELDKFINAAHAVFPYCYLAIITNGILIPALADHVLRTIKENNVLMLISWYESNTAILNKIKEILDQYQINYRISSYKGNFRIQYNTTGHCDMEESWLVCRDRLCHTIVDGKLSGCYFAATVKHANEYFGLKIPHAEYEYDLYDDNLSAIEIIKRITSPTLLCSYCNGNRSGSSPAAAWRRAGKEKTLADWFDDID